MLKVKSPMATSLPQAGGGAGQSPGEQYVAAADAQGKSNGEHREEAGQGSFECAYALHRGHDAYRAPTGRCSVPAPGVRKSMVVGTDVLAVCQTF